MGDIFIYNPFILFIFDQFIYNHNKPRYNVPILPVLIAVQYLLYLSWIGKRKTHFNKIRFR